MCTANGWLEDQELLYDGICALEKLWNKCVSGAEDYVEKFLTKFLHRSVVVNCVRL